jgi:hypothetical protein
MTENKQAFQVRQSIDVNGKTRVIEFIINKMDTTQQITLQITEDNKRILSISVNKEAIVDQDEKANYKHVINIDRFTSEADISLAAEVVDHRGRDFWWFEIPEESLTAFIRERSVESLVTEFIRDLLNYLSSNISIKARQE